MACRFRPPARPGRELAPQGPAARGPSLSSTRRALRTGPQPTDGDGAPLAPRDAWGHDHLWWLDRMVRSNQPLVERMTLIWHDWFATSNDGVGSQKLMLRPERAAATHALGSFADLLLNVTTDPAMLLWLNGTENSKWSPNENYARELMELFMLGAGRGYTEDDVREQARALTGWRNDWNEGAGDAQLPLRPEPPRHRDEGDLRQARQLRLARRCRLCLHHPLHAVVLRAQALELLHPDRAGRDHRAAR